MQNSKFLVGLARYSGLAALLIYVVTCGVIVVVNYRDASYTISRHIGLAPVTMGVFAGVGTVAAGLLLFNLFAYCRRRWDFGRFFVVYAVTTVVCLMLVGWFPYAAEGDVVIRTIHRVAAWAMIFLTPMFALGFLWKLRGRPGGLLRVALILMVAEATVLILMMMVVREFFASIALYVESVYLISMVGLTQVLAFASSRELRLRGEI